MNLINLTRVGVALVTCAAICSILLSRGAFAQGDDRGHSGLAALMGNATVRSNDPRFQPLAAMVVNEAAGGGLSAAKGNNYISQTVLTDFFDRYIVHIPRGAARGAEPRPVTASEALLLEELFSRNLGSVRGLEVSKDGLAGAVKPQDLHLRPQELIGAAKARGDRKSKWYDKGAKELGPGL